MNVRENVFADSVFTATSLLKTPGRLAENRPRASRLGHGRLLAPARALPAEGSGASGSAAKTSGPCVRRRADPSRLAVSFARSASSADHPGDKDHRDRQPPVSQHRGPPRFAGLGGLLVTG